MKKNLSKILIAATMTFASLLSLGASIFASATIADTYTEDQDSSFAYTDGNGHIYDVYHLNEAVDASGYTPVSLCYKGNASGTGSTITVPETFTASGTNYITYALSECAFAYQTFTTINLPNSIREIKAQAFIGCTSLTAIQIPYHVTEIAPSTFMDCRKLSSIRYSDVNGDISKTNNRITAIKDHAFTSCVSLRSLTFPTSLSYVGKSAFQGCIALVSALLTTDVNLEIDEYAFTNCYNMNIIYISDLVTAIGDYAMSNCHKLSIYTSLASEAALNTKFDKNGQHLYRKRYTSTHKDVNSLYVPVVCGVQDVNVDDYHPDFVYAVKTDNICLTSSKGARSDHSKGKCPYCVLKQASSSASYASIIGYTGSNEDGIDFVASTGTITIPNVIDGLQVCQIDSGAFTGHTEIRNIVLNENLVKISEKAFVGVTGIESIDFNRCTNLKEIGPYAFGTDGVKADTADARVGNNTLTRLELPASLYVIDGCAFRYFYKLEYLSFQTPADIAAGRESQLAIIGRRAFNRCGESATNKDKCDLVLPHSLSDKTLWNLRYCFLTNGDGLGPDLNIDYNNGGGLAVYESFVIGAFCFLDSRFVHYLTMEECPDGCTRHDDTSTSDSASFGNSAFKHTGIHAFVSSRALYRMHVMAFQYSYYLHSALLYSNLGYGSRTTDYCGANLTDPSKGNGNYPSGIAWRNNIFGYSPNVVVYVSGTSAQVYDKKPSNIEWLEDSYASGSTKSTGVGCYKDRIGTSFSNNSRQHIPVYYDCADIMDDIKTMVTNSSNIFHTIKRSEGKNQYYSILTNYQGTASSIDLSSIVSSCSSAKRPIKEIGAYAFANINYAEYYKYDSAHADTDHYENRFKVFSVVNLPTTLETIGEGAFYSQETDKYFDPEFSVTKVTTGAGTASVSYTGYNKTNTSNITDNYCILPDSVKHIGKRAFFNNSFKYIKVGPNIEFLGARAFVTLCNTDVGRYAKTECFIFGSNSKFIYNEEGHVDNNIYYKVEDGKYWLIQNANYYYDENKVYTYVQDIREGTEVIMPQAFAGCRAKTINIPGSLKTIYGQAFASTNVTKITGDLSGIEYISSWTGSKATEAYQENNGFTEMGGAKEGQSYVNDGDYEYGAFRYARYLETINFLEMTSLKGIGKHGFYQCVAFKYLTGSPSEKSYTYKTAASNGTTSVTVSGKTDGVLDLRNCTELRRIGEQAFYGNRVTIGYAHLPSSTNWNTTVESKMNKIDSKIFELRTISILVGESALQASTTQTALNASSHYNSAAFSGSNNQGAYYFAKSKSDVIQSGADSLNYWCYDYNDASQQTFVLMKTKAVANAYFNANSSHYPA